MKNYNDYRIAITGSQGSGKTTLAYAWANSVGGKVLNQSSKDVMDIFNFKSHYDILKACVNSPQVGIQFQTTLANEKLLAMMQAEGGFITDRSLIDIFSYYTIQNSMFSTTETDEFMQSCLSKSFDYLDLLVCLEPKLDTVAENNIRTTSKLYYDTVKGLMENVLSSVMWHTSRCTFNDFEYFYFEDEDIEFYLNTKNKFPIVKICESTGMLSTDKRISTVKKAIDIIKEREVNKL